MFVRIVLKSAAAIILMLMLLLLSTSEVDFVYQGF
jgi:hypothetical protein